MRFEWTLPMPYTEQLFILVTISAFFVYIASFVPYMLFGQRYTIHKTMPHYIIWHTCIMYVRLFVYLTHTLIATKLSISMHARFVLCFSFFCHLCSSGSERSTYIVHILILSSFFKEKKKLNQFDLKRNTYLERIFVHFWYLTTSMVFRKREKWDTIRKGAYKLTSHNS